SRSGLRDSFHTSAFAGASLGPCIMEPLLPPPAQCPRCRAAAFGIARPLCQADGVCEARWDRLIACYPTQGSQLRLEPSLEHENMGAANARPGVVARARIVVPV